MVQGVIVGMLSRPLTMLDRIRKYLIRINHQLSAIVDTPGHQPSSSKGPPKQRRESLDSAPFTAVLGSYTSYVFLFLVGYFRELFYGPGHMSADGVVSFAELNRDGYVALFSVFESFYTRNVVRRMKDIFFRPISSVPGATVDIIRRKTNDFCWSFSMDPSDTVKCINLSSYNYLGFAESSGPVTDAAVDRTSEVGLTNCSTRHELGTTSVHQEIESLVAQFLGTEAAVTVGMGFATNSLNLPRLLSKGTLVLSDEKNHASLILGLRLSGATVKVFKHNDTEALEKTIRKAILHGQPRTRRPWKKIVIVVEGVYSMEGSIVNLPAIVEIKKRYKAYVYLDEAHSVGAMGPKGRGVVDYFGLDPKDIDIMMGTFTKSFGSAGGYIAGSRSLINYLKVNSQASVYPTSMSPPVAQQIISSMQSIMDQKKGDGMGRIRKLARNSCYFRKRLQQMGFIVYGHNDSPVVPVMVFSPTKIAAIIRDLFDNRVACVGAGFPATDMTEERVRFCISASHTKEQLDEALETFDKVANKMNIKFARDPPFSEEEISY